MKGKICTLMTLMVMAASGTTTAQNADIIKEWEETTWRLNITFEDGSADIPALQFAVFKSDPVPEFTGNFRKFSSRVKEEGKERYTDEWSMLSVTWDMLFSKITGDQVYLVVTGKEPVILSSNEVPGRIWLVTKSNSSSGEPVAWSVCLDVKTGKSTDVRLDEKNRISLKKIK